MKGLKNAHTLVARVYEKGPQTLACAIPEVEKLQAVQQLTATLLPSTQSIAPDQLLGTITCTGTDIAGQDHSHTLADIEVTVTMTHTKVIPDHITDATTGALHDTVTPALIVITVTHHTGDHSHVDVPQLIP